jgi:hypothetical protein
LEFLSPGTLNEPGLLVTAFEIPDGKSMALVVVNTNEESLSLRFKLTGGTVAGPIRGEVSNGDARRTPLTPFQPAAAATIEYEAPGRSVTTLSVRLP